MKWMVATALVVGLVASAAQAQHEVEDCGLESPGVVWGPAVAPRPNELPALQPHEPPRVVREARSPFLHSGTATPRLRTGALSGKTVYVSAGHGFYWHDTLNNWLAQRGNTNDIVEDLVSTETASQYLIPMLLNAGAYVVPMREFDLNTSMVVVDDADADFSETGPSGTFSASSVTGYGHPPSPLQSGTNPLALGGNRLMEATVGATPTASAAWVPNVPKDGYYNVYISYSQFTYRVPDAHFVVKHAGGEAHFRVNQRRHGATWVFLGRFYFRQGRDAARGAVVALNDSSETGNISLDAVRLGGGMGTIARPNSSGALGPVSGRPRFEEAARYHAQLMGAPPSVYDNASLKDQPDDVSARSRFAAWDHETGEDAVYVAWHTNACGPPCTARGTDTYVYGPNPPDGTYNFTGVAGSDALAQAVHAELVKDLKSGWDPNWKDRGIHSAYFGELNPNHNGETPSILLEVAFHMTPLDATQLKEPHFRYIAARGIAQGIIKYFAAKDGKAPALPPEPPIRASARNLGNGSVRVSWAAAPTDSVDLAGGVATSYRLYSSVDGFAWDDGVEVTGTSTLINVPPGETRFFRVTALNAGGESFPSEIVGASVPANGGLAPILIVNAFDRLDAALGWEEDLAKHDLATPLRLFNERMNDGTYVRRHGMALAQNDVTFDSATAAAVESGAVELSRYAMVDWFVGRGASGTVQIPPAQQTALRAYVEGGGRLVLSGSNIASVLATGSATDQSFLAQVLRVSAANAGGTSSVSAISGEAFDGMGPVLLDSDGRNGAYPAGTPDVLTPMNATALAVWTGSMNTAALRGDGPGKIAFLSFPFETIVSETQRAEVMARLLTALDVPVAPYPWDGGMEPEPDAGMQPTDAGTSEMDAGMVPVQPDPPVTFEALDETVEFDEAGGCGCNTGSTQWAAFALLPLLALFARRRRSSR